MFSYVTMDIWRFTNEILLLLLSPTLFMKSFQRNELQIISRQILPTNSTFTGLVLRLVSTVFTEIFSWKTPPSITYLCRPLVLITVSPLTWMTSFGSLHCLVLYTYNCSSVRTHQRSLLENTLNTPVDDEKI